MPTSIKPTRRRSRPARDCGADSIADRRPEPAFHTLRLLELAALYFGLPAIYWLGFVPLAKIPFLLIVVAGIGVALAFDGSFDRRRLWETAPLGSEWPRIVRTFSIGAAGLTAYTFLAHRERFFELPLEEPWAWGALMVLYPLLSVFPQEVVYRTFFYHRYAAVLPGRWTPMLLNAAAFGAMHIVYENWIAVVLTALGGLLFARTYERTGSTLAACFEHALYGCLIFTIGLGEFFS